MTTQLTSPGLHVVEPMSLEDLFAHAESLSPSGDTGICVWRNKYNGKYHVDFQMESKSGAEIKISGDNHASLKAALASSIEKAGEFT